jgi:lipopolysaccharide assembly outer membrane protein LptD (OstA)
MNKLRALLCLLSLSLTCARSDAAEPENPIRVESLTEESIIEYNLAEGIVTATNGVIVRYGDPKQGETELSASRALLNQNTGDIVAEGAVFLQREGQLWTGERLEYNFKTKTIRAAEFKTGKTPFFVSGLSLTADQTNKTYSVGSSFITTDDVSEPGYRVRCRSLTIIPGKKFEAHHATLLLGNVPIFYWPRYERSLERHPNNIELTPGYRSLYGAYLLGTYNWFVSPRLSGSIHADYREKRGFAGGPDLNYDLGRWGKGEFQFYFAHDREPGTNAFGTIIRDDRHRFSFTHKAELATNFTAQVVFREQGDPLIIRDFFEREYRQNVQPSSFLEVNKLWSNWSLNALAQPRVNDFFETVERLPDLKLSGLRQQLGISPFYYESESSVGYYKHTFADNALPDFAAGRADSFHQLLLPQNFLGWLNVTPRVGGRFTHYSESEGLGAATTIQNRWVFNTGLETSFKASRVWQAAENKLFDVHGLRHVIEPSVNYVYVPAPTVRPPLLPQFDPELPSLRLLPVEYPDYNAIDAVDSQNVLRLGVRNHIQTKRQDRVETLVNWAIYSDWRLKPRTGQTTFSDVFSDLDFKPRSWITFNSETRYDIANGVFRLADHRIVLEPNDRWSLSAGHRYFREDPVLGVNSGNNLLHTSVHFRLNENWAVRATHYFEARDGTLEEQFYALQRDFRSWTGALTCRFRDNRTGRSDFTIAVTFSLKAFPRFKLGHDRDAPSLLLGS